MQASLLEVVPVAGIGQNSTLGAHGKVSLICRAVACVLALLLAASRIETGSTQTIEGIEDWLLAGGLDSSLSQDIFIT